MEENSRFLDIIMGFLMERAVFFILKIVIVLRLFNNSVFTHPFVRKFRNLNARREFDYYYTSHSRRRY